MPDPLRLRARELATAADDPWGGPAPIAYVGPGLAALLLSVPVADALHGTVRAVVLATLVAAGVAGTAVTATRGLRAARRRALANVTGALSWIVQHAGAERADTVAADLDQPGALTRYAEAWQTVERISGLDAARFDQLLIGSIDAAAQDSSCYQLPYAVRGECFPRTIDGWHTDDHAKDVTPAALSALLAAEAYTPSAFRGALRRELRGDTELAGRR